MDFCHSVKGQKRVVQLRNDASKIIFRIKVPLVKVNKVKVKVKVKAENRNPESRLRLGSRSRGQLEATSEKSREVPFFKKIVGFGRK